MFIVLKRKKIVIYTCVILALLCCYIGVDTVIFNDKEVINTNAEIDDKTNELMPGEALAVSNNENYFFKTITDREFARSKSTEILTKIIDDPASSPEAKSKAEVQLINMADAAEKEVKIESILYAKGFNESVVFISEGVTTVAIKTEKLSQEDAAKINDIASEITGNNNIKIVEVK